MMPTARKLDLATRLRIARRAAQLAGDVIMAHYGRDQTIHTKSSQLDLVTQVDLEADELIRDLLKEECPDDVVITEESFQEGQAIDLSSAWIVDPLDGTTNYAHGFPHFAVSIAYVENAQPKAAVIFDPFKNELFTALEDGEVLRNGIPIRVGQTETLSKALLATGFPYNLQTAFPQANNVDLHNRFLQVSHGIRRAGAAALDLAYVACARLDGFWELRLSPWDVAAGMLIIQRAGGVVTDFDGNPIDLHQRHINIVGANPTLHSQMLDITRRNEAF